MSTKPEGRSHVIFRDENPITAIGMNVSQDAQFMKVITRSWVNSQIDMFRNADRSLIKSIEGDEALRQELEARGQFEQKVAHLKKLLVAYDNLDVRQKVWEWLCTMHNASPDSDTIQIDQSITIPTDFSKQ